MVRGLQIQNGDLVLGTRGYAEVTGSAKIIQDLTVAILTPYGSDSDHPNWGSVLNNKIGQPQGSTTQQLISSEIQRIITAYMANQQAVLSTYINNGWQSPYSNQDLVSGISNINVAVSYDAATASVSISTVAGQTISVPTTVTNTGVAVG